MSQGFAPFYDVNRTYEDNYLQGPFGAFAEVLRADASDSAGSVTSVVAEVASDSSSEVQGVQTIQAAQAQEFLGFRVNLPFGIPAGPLLNERFTTAAFRMGFDLAVYKTVRSRAWGCNAFPNVLAVHPRNADGSLVPGSAELDEGVLADTRYELPISISNSFGVPSRDPDEWQPDMQKAIAAAGDNVCGPAGRRQGRSQPPQPVTASCWCRASKAPAWRAWIVKRISPIMSPPRIWLPKLALA